MKKKENKLNKEAFTNWLNTAIPFSIWRWSNKQHVIDARDHISNLIGEKYRQSRDKGRDRDMLLVFLLNLWVGFCTGCPIQISLNTNKYSRQNVYGRVFFTYKRTRRILLKLERMGYLQRITGYFFDEDKKETRIWATEKLVRLFVGYHFQPVGDVISLKQTDLVQLRLEKTKMIPDKKKPGKFRKVKYYEEVEPDETDELIEMRSFLEQYNALAKKQRVLVKLDEQDMISPSILIESILEGFCAGTITLIGSELLFKDPVENQTYANELSSSMTSDQVGSSVASEFSDIPGLMITSLSYGKYSYPTITIKDDPIEHIDIDSFLITITNTLYNQQWQAFQPESTLFLYLFYIKRLFQLIKFKGQSKEIRKIQRNELLRMTRPIADFGIKYLEFEIKGKYLHRVFNRGDQSLKFGGRFYGSFYQGISKEIRQYIQINGNDTVELDYSGLHIRMLYDQLKIACPGDPYAIDDGVRRSKEEADEIRNAYKLVALISVNAKKRGAHIAVRDALSDGGFKCARNLNTVIRMKELFKDQHKPIEKYLFSGIGIELQNTDSHIIEDVLKVLYDKGIIGLPIHDSVIIEKEHEALLYELMMEKYFERIGTYPKVK